MAPIDLRELEKRLLDLAESLGYQVLLGPSWIGGSPGSHWDNHRRESYSSHVAYQGLWGQCDFEHQLIWLSPSMSDRHRIAILVHELGHAMLHGKDVPSNERQREAEAEEVRRIVGEVLEIDLPAHGDEWELLSKSEQRTAFQRGRRASQKIISSVWD